jgi:predicted TIM-barrel fold metal-dependent hydrolase
MDNIPIIDAHQHFWDLRLNKNSWLNPKKQIPFRYGDYSSICKNFLISDYKEISKNHNIVKTVHMETEWDPKDPVGETKWLHKLYDETGFPNAIVGQAWFDRQDIDSVLSGHMQYPLIRSIRHKPKISLTPDIQNLNPKGTLNDPVFRQGYSLLKKHNLHYDLQIPWWHLPDATKLAKDFPDTIIILNHTGLPSDRSKDGLNNWKSNMKQFSEQPNTALKISGICVPNEKWTSNLNKNIIKDSIDIFGYKRCMFASNFPVDGVIATFDEIFNGFKEIVSSMKDYEIKSLFHDNAIKYYNPK